jgi:hypothetical protein
MWQLKSRPRRSGQQLRLPLLLLQKQLRSSVSQQRWHHRQWPMLLHRWRLKSRQHRSWPQLRPLLLLLQLPPPLLLLLLQKQLRSSASQ